MKQIFLNNPWQVRSFKRILKRFALRICAQIHYKIVLNLIKVFQQSIGFGYDSGIENEKMQKKLESMVELAIQKATKNKNVDYIKIETESSHGD
jgi:hypothetical protein